MHDDELDRGGPLEGRHMMLRTALTVLTTALCFLAPALMDAATDRFVAAKVQPVPSPVPAPTFALKTPEGRSLGSADLRGKVILINFWATWCGPCKEEMPALERLQRRLGDSNFVLVAVTTDLQPVTIAHFARGLGLNFPILLDETKDVSAAYGVRGLPTTVLIDRQGRLVGRAVGPRDWDGPEAAALLAELLE
jgi:thiol-disulfide isomerase/thioredoxin